MAALLKRLWNVISEPLARVEADHRAYLASEKSRRIDWKVILVPIAVALVLTAQEYFGSAGHADGLADLADWLGLERLAALVRSLLDHPSDGKLYRRAYWACGCFICYFLVPALVVRLVFRERLSDYGVKAKGAFQDAWIYAVMLAVMAPLVWLVSMRSSFQATYPFYLPEPDDSLWPRFWIWEALYFVQFFALEFFFRGFMVHGLKHRFGGYAIFVMVVPYCMIHFHKPLLETVAAIVAGVVLGLMSLKTRSIWFGTFVHIAVALSMDLTSLWRCGYFG